MWTFALLDLLSSFLFCHRGDKAELSGATLGFLPQFLQTKSRRGLFTSNFHPSFSKLIKIFFNFLSSVSWQDAWATRTL